MLIIQILILWNSSSSPYMSPVSFDVSSHSPLSFANNYNSLHFISKLHTKLSLFLCIYCAFSRKVRVSWAFWLCFPLPWNVFWKPKNAKSFTCKLPEPTLFAQLPLDKPTFDTNFILFKCLRTVILLLCLLHTSVEY